jgi:DNA-binding MarR family transcriptional regulator
MVGPAGYASAIPETLPSDLTKSQFVILRSYRQGLKGPKEIGRALSMDRKEVEMQTNSLVQNGYLTGGNKLTAKGLDLLG